MICGDQTRWSLCPGCALCTRTTEKFAVIVYYLTHSHTLHAMGTLMQCCTWQWLTVWGCRAERCPRLEQQRAGAWLWQWGADHSRQLDREQLAPCAVSHSAHPQRRMRSNEEGKKVVSIFHMDKWTLPVHNMKLASLWSNGGEACCVGWCCSTVTILIWAVSQNLGTNTLFPLGEAIDEEIRYFSDALLFFCRECTKAVSLPPLCSTSRRQGFSVQNSKTFSS